MKTKIFMLFILAVLIANSGITQNTTNPRLTNTYNSRGGYILIVDSWDFIQASDKKIDDIEGTRFIICDTLR